MKAIFYFLSILGVSALCVGCQSASYHSGQVQKDSEKSDRLTVGKVQREIKVGMPSADVVGILGSPNIVTTDDQHRESWVYDKIATNASYSKSEGGIFLLLGGVSGASGASSTSQRTLTVIIKFDEAQKVRDFSYHSSSF
jgi:outer membrane protein assembly factor BamE (lipoprotein component of BamABCDE complex)